MHLAIYVHRRLGLTLDLAEDRLQPLPGSFRVGPAFGRLTAAAGRLRDPVLLYGWLTAFPPENGSSLPFSMHASEAWPRHRRDSLNTYDPVALLWGNVDAEYAGAIDFVQAERDPPDRLPDPGPPRYEPLRERTISHRLGAATLIAQNAYPGRPETWPQRRTVLSGMRGKFGLTPGAGGGWTAACGDSLNSWIVKAEYDPRNPGEAGVEAIVQRTFGLLGIPAATTRARVFDGRQAVLSERADRVTGAGGIVRARHQEEWCQILAFEPSRKYDRGRRDEPRWPSAYRLLADHAADPEREQATLTRVVAAMWLLGHCDLHRRNLGFRHAPAAAPSALELAPVYDASSPFGTRFSDRLAIGIAGQSRLHAIQPRHWVRHSQECGIDPGTTLDMVRQLLRDLPDAIATGREQARTGDENVLQTDVDRRADATLEHVQKRRRAFAQQDAARARRQTVQTAGTPSPSS